MNRTHVTVIAAVAALAALALAGCKKEERAAAPSTSGTSSPGVTGKGLFATLKTNKGEIVVRLFPEDAPKTVDNFVALAKGTKEWRDPRSGELVKKPLYDGVIFHRVIPGFMIQGGDPLGMGMGGPGYKFEDEFQSGRTFDKPGLLAMANSGPNTNGSQFFITTSTPHHLDNHHTIFGEVVSGYDVVETISHVPTTRGNRPVEPVTISTIQITDNR